MEFGLKNWFIRFHEFFGPDFFKNSGPLFMQYLSKLVCHCVGWLEAAEAGGCVTAASDHLRKGLTSTCCGLFSGQELPTVPSGCKWLWVRARALLPVGEDPGDVEDFSAGVDVSQLSPRLLKQNWGKKRKKTESKKQTSKKAGKFKHNNCSKQIKNMQKSTYYTKRNFSLK